MAVSDDALHQNEGSRAARPEPLPFLLFMCPVATTSATHQAHKFSSLLPHIDLTTASSKEPMNHILDPRIILPNSKWIIALDLTIGALKNRQGTGQEARGRRCPSARRHRRRPMPVPRSTITNARPCLSVTLSAMGEGHGVTPAAIPPRLPTGLPPAPKAMSYPQGDYLNDNGRGIRRSAGLDRPAAHARRSE